MRRLYAPDTRSSNTPPLQPNGPVDQPPANAAWQLMLALALVVALAVVAMTVVMVMTVTMTTIIR